MALAILPHPFHLRLGLIHFTNWRIYLLIVLIPTLLSFCILLFMPNSLRFVLSQQDPKQVKKVLNKINGINSCFTVHWYWKKQVYSKISTVDIDFDRNIANCRRNNKSTFISHFRNC